MMMQHSDLTERDKTITKELEGEVQPATSNFAN